MRYGILNDIRLLDKRSLTQTVQRYVNLGLENKSQNLDENALEIPFPKLAINEKNRNDLLERLCLSTDKPIIGLMPGAEYGEAKQWPYFNELAKELSNKGYRVWIFGSNKDAVLGKEIAIDNENIINLCGTTGLVDVVDLISICHKVVSNDSGLMHIAAAVNIPLIAIYGSSTPEYTPPLTEKAKIHYLELACSPCFKRICPLRHTNCLNFITVKDVLNSIEN